MEMMDDSSCFAMIPDIIKLTPNYRSSDMSTMTSNDNGEAASAGQGDEEEDLSDDSDDDTEALRRKLNQIRQAEKKETGGGRSKKPA